MKPFEFAKNLPHTLSYVVSFYSYLVAIHLFITAKFLNSTTGTWYARVIPDKTTMLSVFCTIPVVIGTVLVVALVRKHMLLMKTGLAATWVYHLSLSVLNVIYYGGTGTPWIPALFVGITALLLYLNVIAQE
jgi:hypothetical protein